MIANGFVKEEAQLALNICAQLEEKDSAPEPPKHWIKIFDGYESEKGIGPFNHAWELWKRDGQNRYAVSVRGTTYDAGSIISDALATTLRSDGFLELGPDDRRLPLLFSPIEGGAVHLGFAWGAAILLFDKNYGILKELLNLPFGSEIYIIGHSQGAAIATLVHALLHYASQPGRNTKFCRGMFAKQFDLKSIVFAQPKPGNWQFAQDMAKIAGNEGRMICINNSRDWVTQVPFSFGLVDDITGNPIRAALGQIPLVGRLSADALGATGRGLRYARRLFGELISDNIHSAKKYLFENIDNEYLSEECGGMSSSASVNYSGCGRLVSVDGYPDEREATDTFWQHHLTTYGALIDEQLPYWLP